MAQGRKKSERNSKSPAERAQDALDTANRVVTRLEGRVEDAEKVVTGLKGQLADAKARRDYAAMNPALPEIPDPDTVTDDALLKDPEPGQE